MIPPLATLVGVELGGLELVIDEVEFGGAGEIADRENAAQRLLETRDITDRGVRAQELLVALALDLDQVRHLHDFVDVAENLADTALGGAAFCCARLGRALVGCLGRHGVFALKL
ncbi:hypothetical protein ABIC16_001160 [Sphingomonas sp. PvP055]